MNSSSPSLSSDHQTNHPPEFPFIESKESKFYRNFLKKWDEFYPDSAERRVEKEEEPEVEETKTETETETEEKTKTEKKTKPEVRIEKETLTAGSDQPKKIFDYKSKKYIEQNWKKN